MSIVLSICKKQIFCFSILPKTTAKFALIHKTKINSSNFFGSQVNCNKISNLPFSTFHLIKEKKNTIKMEIILRFHFPFFFFLSILAIVFRYYIRILWVFKKLNKHSFLFKQLNKKKNPKIAKCYIASSFSPFRCFNLKNTKKLHVLNRMQKSVCKNHKPEIEKENLHEKGIINWKLHCISFYSHFITEVYVFF